MSLVLLAKNKDLKPWIQNLQNLNKNLDIEIYPNIKDYDKVEFALVWSSFNIDFKKFKNLKCIASMGAGVDHIITNKTISKSVHITKIVDETLVVSMWQYLQCVVLNIVNNHYEYVIMQKNKQWKQLETKAFSSYTIGIMGLGQLGSFVAKEFYKMGFNIKAYSTSKKDIKGVKSFTNQDKFLKDVDILINLLPLTKDTKNILNEKLFNKLNKNSSIINVGRGQHLKEKDLLKAIKNKKIKTAILDVFKNEPLKKSSKLYANNRIFITPHSASLTNPNSVSKQILDNYERVKKNKIPKNCINRKKEY